MQLCWSWLCTQGIETWACHCCFQIASWPNHHSGWEVWNSAANSRLPCTRNWYPTYSRRDPFHRQSIGWIFYRDFCTCLLHRLTYWSHLSSFWRTSSHSCKHQTSHRKNSHRLVHVWSQKGNMGFSRRWRYESNDKSTRYAPWMPRIWDWACCCTESRRSCQFCGSESLRALRWTHSYSMNFPCKLHSPVKTSQATEKACDCCPEDICFPAAQGVLPPRSKWKQIAIT